MSQKLNFIVNAEIKNILGRGLIYDDNVAIIELVKNGKDAKSKKVVVKFENEIADKEHSELIIKDYGKGMTLLDIKEKWLNLAYSEKKNNHTEGYAGNKGIGRLSCDRLGEEVILFTKAVNGSYIKMPIYWNKFENKGIKDNLENIKLEYEFLNEASFLKEIAENKFKSGTVLKIKKLRSDWTDAKLKKLITELEKFSPSLDKDFEVEIFSSIDRKDKELKNKINKKIDNGILEKLSFKTIYIASSISSDGKNIFTQLFYHGNEVYSYTAKNPYELLKNIKVEIHYLDTFSKSYFTRRTGLQPTEYGSVFLFYNNFRVSPYGNPSNDWLGLDRRKAQGTKRFLGTRELFGRIDIIDLDETFTVVTSREGLAFEGAFEQLIALDKDISLEEAEDNTHKRYSKAKGYVPELIRQLETFVVDGIGWSRVINKYNPEETNIQESEILLAPNNYSLTAISPEHLSDICSKLSASIWNAKDFKINFDLLNNITSVAEEKFKKYVSDFFTDMDSEDYLKTPSKYKTLYKKIIKDKDDKIRAAEAARNKAEYDLKNADKKIAAQKQHINIQNNTIQQINSQNAFLKVAANQDVDMLLESMHAIINYSENIGDDTYRILSEKDIPENIKARAMNIREANQKIHTISKFATLYNFTNKERVIKGELVLFIKKYLEEAAAFSLNKNIKIVDKLAPSLVINKDFIPLEIMMMLDNILSNSRKAAARNIIFELFKTSADETVLQISDDGRGISNKIDKNNINILFDKGITTTGGAGLGLYQVKKVVNKLGGDVHIMPSATGFALRLVLK